MLNQNTQIERSMRKPQSFCEMTCTFMAISLPLVIRQNLMNLIFLINAIFAARLSNPAKTAGVGLGTTMNHIFGACILHGLNRAMDTLVSQAYGAGNISLCSVYLNRARVINSLVFIPVALTLLNSKGILLWLS